MRDSQLSLLCNFYKVIEITQQTKLRVAHVELVVSIVSSRDVTSQVEFGLYSRRSARFLGVPSVDTFLFPHWSTNVGHVPTPTNQRRRCVCTSAVRWLIRGVHVPCKPSVWSYSFRSGRKYLVVFDVVGRNCSRQLENWQMELL